MQSQQRSTDWPRHTLCAWQSIQRTSAPPYFSKNPISASIRAIVDGMDASQLHMFRTGRTSSCRPGSAAASRPPGRRCSRRVGGLGQSGRRHGHARRPGPGPAGRRGPGRGHQRRAGGQAQPARRQVFVEHGGHAAAGLATMVAASSPSPSVSRAITCEPLSESSASAPSSMGVNWKSSSLFSAARRLGVGREGSRGRPRPTRAIPRPGGEVQRRFQRQAAVGRIDQRDAAVAADGDVAAGAAAAQHQVVVFQFLAAEIDGRVASAWRPCRPAAEATAVFQRQVLIQRQIEFLELRDLGGDLVFLPAGGRLAWARRQVDVAVGQSFTSLSARRMSLSAEALALLGADDRARSAAVRVGPARPR